MELILKQDVENLGFKDDIVTVKNGYGRNFLIPQGVAILATKSSKKVLEETIKQQAYKEKKNIDDATAKANAIKALDIKIASKVGVADKLFGSVNNIDLAEALAKENIEVDKKFISILGGSVKRLGPYEATIRLHREVLVDIQFEVVAQN